MEDPPASDEQQRDDGARADPPAVGTVYTAVTGDYDRHPLRGYREDRVVVDVRRETMVTGREATLWNRQQKILRPPTRGAWSVYLDGSMQPRGPLRRVVEKTWLKKHEFALFKHPHRRCAYDEIDACVARKKIKPKEAEQARSHLQLSGFPKDYGLWACGMIARRTQNVLGTYISGVWWGFVKDVPRDQIWLPFLLWKIKDARKRVFTIDDDVFNSRNFKFRGHGS